MALRSATATLHCALSGLDVCRPTVVDRSLRGNGFPEALSVTCVSVLFIQIRQPFIQTLCPAFLSPVL